MQTIKIKNVRSEKENFLNLGKALSRKKITLHRKRRNNPFQKNTRMINQDANKDYSRKTMKVSRSVKEISYH